MKSKTNYHFVLNEIFCSYRSLVRNLIHCIDLNLIIIIVLLGFTYFWGYSGENFQSLTAHDEGLYVGRAKLMLEQNNWFTPFSTPHHKTVGSYWLIALSMKILGFSEFSARLPSGICSILCSITLYYISKRILSIKAALFSSLSLASMPLWFQYSRYASPDIVYILLVLIIILLLQGININSTLSDRKSKIYTAVIGTLISISFLIRSFMILLPIFALIPIFIYITGSNTIKLSRYLILGLLIGLLPSLLTTFVSYREYGTESLYSIFGFFKDKAIGGNLLKSIIFYPTNIILLSFPLGLFSIIGIKPLISKGNSILNKLFLCPLIIYICLSLISSRHAHYTLVLYPFISLLAGIAFDKINSNGPSKTNKLEIVFASLFILVGFSVLLLTHLTSIGAVDIISDVDPIFIKSTISISLIYLIIGILSAIRLLNHKQFIYSFCFVILLQTIIFTNLYSLGLMGNPNPNIKSFIQKNLVSSIINTEKIYLFDIEGKAKTLLQCYIPQYRHYNKSLDELSSSKYFIIETSRLIEYESANATKFNHIATYEKLTLSKHY